MAAGRYKSADLARHHCCPAALLNRSANCRGANDVGCFARSEREVVPSSVLPARLLRHAIPESSYAHNAGLARLFGRLRGGLPVRALALGSSVTATGAGCSASLVPYCPRCCGVLMGLPRGYWMSNRGDGFLRIAWDYLNATWPHPSHRLYNAGRPGAGVDHFIGCLGAWVPDDIDLFVVETGATGVEHARLETLLRQLLRLRPTGHTAIIVLSLFVRRRVSIPRRLGYGTPNGPPCLGYGMAQRPALSLLSPPVKPEPTRSRATLAELSAEPSGAARARLQPSAGRGARRPRALLRRLDAERVAGVLPRVCRFGGR